MKTTKTTKTTTAPKMTAKSRKAKPMSDEQIATIIADDKAYVEARLAELTAEPVVTDNGRPAQKYSKKDRTHDRINRAVSYRFVKHTSEKIPAQMQFLLNLLEDACNGGTITEVDFINQVHESALQTTQNKWLVYQYYRPRMIKLGLIEMIEG